MMTSAQLSVRARRDEHGFVASVIVLALLAVLAALILGNSRVVHSLQRELRLVEQRQRSRPGLEATPRAPARPAPAPAGR
jgi:hypothetical protein